jgi:hypothetical protein
MLLPACAGACVLVLVLVLAIEKRDVRRAQECLGDCPSNRRNRKQTSEVRSPRGLPKTLRDSLLSRAINCLSDAQACNVTVSPSDTTQYNVRVANCIVLYKTISMLHWRSHALLLVVLFFVVSDRIPNFELNGIH